MVYGPFFPGPLIPVHGSVYGSVYATCATYVVLPSFPWRASTSVHDGRRALFSRVHVQPVHGVRVRVRVRGVCHVRGFAQFSMARVNFRPRRPSGTFFPCPRTARSRVRVRVRVRGVCHVRGFAQFSMARVNFRPRRPPGTFFPCPRTARSRGPCKGPCTRRVPRTWFCPVFHGARQLPSTTAAGHFFPVSTYSPFTGSV